MKSKPVGRPPFYDSPAALQEAIARYFEECEAANKPPTMAGLCLFLGFSRRDALLAYERRGAEFAEVVCSARLRMEDDRNQRLLSGKGNVAGVIFDLKNNHGWKDKKEQSISWTGRLDLSRLTDEQLEFIVETGQLPPDLDTNFAAR